MTTPTEVLGSRLTVYGWAFQGIRPPEEMTRYLQGAVRCMGMNTGGLEPVVRQYPVGSKEGIGHTIYVPLGDYGKLSWWDRLVRWMLRRSRFANTIFQPLIESFIVSDDYVELNITYVLAVSCLPFNPQMVSRYLARRIGPIIDMQGFVLIGIRHKEDK